MEQGKSFPGDGRTPYQEPKNNVQHWNEKQTRRDNAGQHLRNTYRETQRDHYGGSYGWDKCRGYTVAKTQVVTRPSEHRERSLPLAVALAPR